MRTKLSGQHNDLQIKIVINAHTFAQPYLVDNVRMTEPGDSTAPGATPTATPLPEYSDEELDNFLQELTEEAERQYEAHLATLPPFTFLEPNLTAALDEIGPNQMLEVDLFLARDTEDAEDDADEELDESLEILEPDADEDPAPSHHFRWPHWPPVPKKPAPKKPVQITLNGEPVSVEAFQQYQEQRDQLMEERLQRRAQRYAHKWRELAKHFKLHRTFDTGIETGASSLTLALTKRQILDLARTEGDGLLFGISLNTETDDPGLVNAVESVGLSTIAFPDGQTGEGIGVWMNDGRDSRNNPKIPNSTTCPINQQRFTLHQGIDRVEDVHATQTTCALQAAAPGAHVHWIIPGTRRRPTYFLGIIRTGTTRDRKACNLLFGDVTSLRPRIRISSISDAYGDAQGPIGAERGTLIGEVPLYTNCNRDWDNWVYDSGIAHFAPTMNEGRFPNEQAIFPGAAGYVRGAAKSYNVIAVGAKHTRNPARATYSNWIGPETGATKPDIFAPGSAQDHPEDEKNWIGLTIGGVELGAATAGTSYATPIAAGFAAALMSHEQRTNLRGRPALLKARLIAGANTVSGLRGPQGTRSLTGRALNYEGTNLHSGSWYWDNRNSELFVADHTEGNKMIKRVSVALRPGGTYRLVLSWLVTGDYVRRNKKPNMNLDLGVRDPTGRMLKVSTSSWQSDERLTFTAAVDGVYHFLIHRRWNSGTGRIKMALVLDRVPDPPPISLVGPEEELQWPQ